MWLWVWLIHTLHSGLQKPRERSLPEATFQNLLHPPTDLPSPCPLFESRCQVLSADAWLLEGRCSFHLTMQACFAVGRAVQRERCISTANIPNARLDSLQLPEPPGFSSFQELSDPGSSLNVGYKLT
uniref:Uncharacterized protein n=1 Tax=Pan troglodytes TaxID=9598 RepID=A0A2I3SHJ4_PANTR